MRYDDDLKLFLLTCLRKIDYFQEPAVSEIELTHIAMQMIAQQADSDSLLIDKRQTNNYQMKESMIIIYEGKLSI